MPTIVKESSNGWTVISNQADIAWQSLEDWQPGQALLLKMDDEPGSEVASASLIGIDFPAFTDGRGLSLAVLLRTRHGYTGELRACGAVHEDILHYMVRCGFNGIELPLERNLETALDLLTPYGSHYQGSVISPRCALRREKRGATA